GDGHLGALLHAQGVGAELEVLNGDAVGTARRGGAVRAARGRARGRRRRRGGFRGRVVARRAAAHGAQSDDTDGDEQGGAGDRGHRHLRTSSGTDSVEHVMLWRSTDCRRLATAPWCWPSRAITRKRWPRPTAATEGRCSPWPV